ncbi:hypothetical protein L1987_77550 [Smallanthus sonchifolius]|uniref:Uncharacterized protein n=1 Tax=Smallanthus sonchifolius TaxID=185202 RepID=A0ACB8ZAH2_9ASTR|nr:hypothetical protein L1987_77550 [Smallanthus sonchifolius]
MLGKKICSIKNLAKKAKVRGDTKSSQSEWLLRDGEEETCLTSSCSSPSCKTPTEVFTLYIGEERRRFVVPTGYLSHPLFKMLLEKSSEAFGFDQKNGLVVPCSVNAFREVVSVVESCKGKCDLSSLVEEFI